MVVVIYGLQSDEWYKISVAPIRSQNRKYRDSAIKDSKSITPSWASASWDRTFRPRETREGQRSEECPVCLQFAQAFCPLELLRWALLDDGVCPDPLPSRRKWQTDYWITRRWTKEAKYLNFYCQTFHSLVLRMLLKICGGLVWSNMTTKFRFMAMCMDNWSAHHISKVKPSVA